MNQRSRLQRLAGLFPGHIAMSEAVEFLINQRHELLKRALVTRAPGSEQACHLVLRWRGRSLETAIHSHRAPDR
jgi:hypothetical protein